MNFESLLTCQERGGNARVLGQSESENPYARSSARSGLDEDQRRQLCDAWAFGWAIEDTMRHIDTGIYGFLRVEAALAGGKAARA